jgi:hypothetical protein
MENRSMLVGASGLVLGGKRSWGLLVGVWIALSPACGGDGGGTSSTPATPEALCQGICGNEAKLSCPNGNEASCNTGCLGLLAQDKQTFPGCVEQINAVFSCYGKVPTTSIQCSATSSSPVYDDGTCAAENAAYSACAVCNSVTNAAPTIDQTQVAEALPTAAATGGTFAPGTYFRTSATVYTGAAGPTGPNGVTDKQTIVLSDAGGGAIIAQSVQSTSGQTEQRGTLKGTPAGTIVSLVITCPVSAPFADFPYTAGTTGFTLYNTQKNVVEVYTRQ